LKSKIPKKRISIFQPEFREDLMYWIKVDRKVALRILDIVEAVTGWETSLYELMEAGERGLVMARMYNLREGFTKQDDNIPPRLTEPLLNGAASGERINPQVLKQAVQDYYAVMGWSEKTGIPGRGKLLSLGLDWLIHSKTV